MEAKHCQLEGLPGMASGNAPLPPLSVKQRLSIFARRHLNRQLRQRIKGFVAPYSDSRGQPSGHSRPDVSPFVAGVADPLQAGDFVRVRSREEIEPTLGLSRDLKGCAFMAEMAPYCGTRQKVLKRVERFVDERDYRVKKSRGIVLLEGAICQGTADYGRCDRSCFFFWREEWLEKIDQGSDHQTGDGE